MNGQRLSLHWVRIPKRYVFVCLVLGSCIVSALLMTTYIFRLTTSPLISALVKAIAAIGQGGSGLVFLDTSTQTDGMVRFFWGAMAAIGSGAAFLFIRRFRVKFNLSDLIALVIAIAIIGAHYIREQPQYARYEQITVVVPDHWFRNPWVTFVAVLVGLFGAGALIRRFAAPIALRDLIALMLAAGLAGAYRILERPQDGYAPEIGMRSADYWLTNHWMVFVGCAAGITAVTAMLCHFGRSLTPESRVALILAASLALVYCGPLALCIIFSILSVLGCTPPLPKSAFPRGRNPIWKLKKSEPKENAEGMNAALPAAGKFPSPEAA